MSDESMRERIAEVVKSAEWDANEFKDAFIVPERLAAFYLGLHASERPHAERVFAEWLESDDEGLRWDALRLVGEQHLRSALPALRDLSQRLRASDVLKAPYEREVVERVIDDLENA